LAMIGSGVPFGANTACQPEAMRSGTVSAMVGRLTRALTGLQQLLPLRLPQSPTHDQLQAIVSGLAGLAIENGDWDLCEIAGVPPIVEDGVWREGFIVSRIVPFGMATSQPKGRHRRMGSGEVLGGGQQMLGPRNDDQPIRLRLRQTNGWDRSRDHIRPSTHRYRAVLRGLRTLAGGDRTGWLGRQDSNLRIPHLVGTV
jgi:hypothetical protein